MFRGGILAIGAAVALSSTPALAQAKVTFSEYEGEPIIETGNTV